MKSWRFVCIPEESLRHVSSAPDVSDDYQFPVYMISRQDQMSQNASRISCFPCRDAVKGVGKQNYFSFLLIWGFESAAFFAYPWRDGSIALCERKKSGYENPLQKTFNFFVPGGFESLSSFANRQRDISGNPQGKEAKSTAGSARKNACTIRHAYECEVNQ